MTSLYNGTASGSKLSTPGVASGTGSSTGGTLAAATYYIKIVAVDKLGNMTAAGAESVGVTTTGTTSSIAYTWTAVSGASSYRIYYGTSIGGENAYYTSNTNSFSLVATSGTAGTPPVSNTTTTSVIYKVPTSTLSGKIQTNDIRISIFCDVAGSLAMNIIPNGGTYGSTNTFDMFTLGAGDNASLSRLMILTGEELVFSVASGSSASFDITIDGIVDNAFLG